MDTKMNATQSALLIKDLQKKVDRVFCPCGKVSCEGFRRRLEYLEGKIAFSDVVLHTLPIVSKFLTL
jgi:hypothetical protein